MPIAKIAAQVQAGKTLAELNFLETPPVNGFFVKEAVLPFSKLPGADPRLSPEMRSTGEVMGHATRFGQAFAKAQIAAGTVLPTKGGVLITVNDFDKGAAMKIGRDLHQMGFRLYATEGTAVSLQRIGLPVEVLQKASQPDKTTVNAIERGEIQLLINTPLGQQAHADQSAMYAAVIRHNVPLITTLSAAQAAVNGIRALREKDLQVRSLQAHHVQQPVHKKA